MVGLLKSVVIEKSEVKVLLNAIILIVCVWYMIKKKSRANDIVLYKFNNFFRNLDKNTFYMLIINQSDAWIIFSKTFTQYLKE